jgi:hypothetical protein
MFIFALTTLCFAGELDGKYIKVLLANGRTLSGKVSYQTKNEITIQAYGGGSTFQNGDIKEITELDENGVELVKVRDLKTLQEAKEAQEQDALLAQKQAEKVKQLELKIEIKDTGNKTAANSTSNNESSSKSSVKDGWIDGMLYNDGVLVAVTSAPQRKKSY